MRINLIPVLGCLFFLAGVFFNDPSVPGRADAGDAIMPGQCGAGCDCWPHIIATNIVLARDRSNLNSSSQCSAPAKYMTAGPAQGRVICLIFCNQICQDLVQNGKKTSYPTPKLSNKRRFFLSLSHRDFEIYLPSKYDSLFIQSFTQVV